MQYMSVRLSQYENMVPDNMISHKHVWNFGVTWHYSYATVCLVIRIYFELTSPSTGLIVQLSTLDSWEHESWVLSHAVSAIEVIGNWLTFTAIARGKFLNTDFTFRTSRRIY